jgi:acyl dehydratase
MTPADMEDMVIGPVTHRVDEDRIAAFVVTTGDDARRWIRVAPPGYAAVLLFAVAGGFLWDPRIADYVRTLIHVDQQFTYPGAVHAGDAVVVTGRVDRVRERAGTFFVTFGAEATVGERVVMSSRSTFLMSDQAAAAPGGDEGEPAAGERSPNEEIQLRPFTGVGDLESVAKSASRSDLVKYAAASADFNPLHWDHDAARAAGLDGVVVHGLLMHAWLAQYAASLTSNEAPVATIKTRFRNALRPAAAAAVSGTVREIAADGRSAEMALALSAAGSDVVTATATIRIGEG